MGNHHISDAPACFRYGFTDFRQHSPAVIAVNNQRIVSLAKYLLILLEHGLLSDNAQKLVLLVGNRNKSHLGSYK